MKPRARRAAIDTTDDLTQSAARFAADCAGLIPPGARLGVAVSGGPDSLALLMLAHRAFPGQVIAATVDHGLRAASADEAAMVADVCAHHGVAHNTLRVTVDPAGNLQANARNVRYRALGEWARDCGAPAVATAHHTEDQAETLLMRLNRGAGLKGLAAMRVRRPMPMATDIALIRPLLGWHRAELAAICASCGLAPVTDPSNTDPRFARARIRAAMAGADWIDPARLAASARHLRDAFEALEAAIDAEFGACVEMLPDQEGAIYRPSLRETGAHGIRFRVLERLLGELGRAHGAPRGPELDRLLAVLESGGTGTLCGMKCAAFGTRHAPEWRLTREPPRKSG